MPVKGSASHKGHWPALAVGFRVTPERGDGAHLRQMSGLSKGCSGVLRSLGARPVEKNMWTEPALSRPQPPSIARASQTE
jgi:hypothetical protein